jgi:hypothetical protein
MHRNDTEPLKPGVAEHGIIGLYSLGGWVRGLPAGTDRGNLHQLRVAPHGPQGGPTANCMNQHSSGSANGKGVCTSQPNHDTNFV